MDEATNVAQEFDWSNVLVIVAMIATFTLTEIFRFLREGRKKAVDNANLMSQVNQLEEDYDELKSEMENLRIEIKAEYKSLEDKVEEKNNKISDMISGLDKKFDKKFDDLSRQIIELFKLKGK